MIKTPYLVLFVILAAVGVSTAYAIVTITLAGNVIVTGDLVVDGDITGPTVTDLQSQINQGVAEQSCPAGKVLVGFDSQGIAICKTIIVLDGSDVLIESGGAQLGLHSSIAIGSDGFPIISYVDRPNKNIKVAKCQDSICSVSTNVILDTMGTRQDQSPISGTAILIGNDNLPVVSYFEDNGFENTFLKIAKCGNADCSAGNTITTLDSPVFNEANPDMSLGTNGNPVLVYSDLSGVLKFIKCGNAACSDGNILVDIPGAPALLPSHLSMTIDNNVFPVMSFDSSGLKVLKCGNDICSSGNTVFTVDSTVGAGQFTSIAIGNDGNPVIAYYEFINDNLKFAKCGNAACSTGNTVSTLDSAGDVGARTSMVLDDGKPVISYLADGSLKIMRCGDSSCSSTDSKVIASPSVFHPALTLGVDGNPVISYNLDVISLRVAVDGTITILE